MSQTTPLVRVIAPDETPVNLTATDTILGLRNRDLIIFDSNEIFNKLNESNIVAVFAQATTAPSAPAASDLTTDSNGVLVDTASATWKKDPSALSGSGKVYMSINYIQKAAGATTYSFRNTAWTDPVVIGAGSTVSYPDFSKIFYRRAATRPNTPSPTVGATDGNIGNMTGWRLVPASTPANQPIWEVIVSVRQEVGGFVIQATSTPRLMHKISDREIRIYRKQVNQPTTVTVANFSLNSQTGVYTVPSPWKESDPNFTSGTGTVWEVITTLSYDELNGYSLSTPTAPVQYSADFKQILEDVDDNEEQIGKIKGGQAGQTAVNPDTTNLRTLKSDSDDNEEQIGKIKGGQAGQTAVNPDTTNLRTIREELGNPSSVTSASQAADTMYKMIQEAFSSGGGGGGTPGANGQPGRQVAIFFREGANKPANPSVSENTSGTFVTINTPTGWSTTPPANPTEKVWLIIQSGQPNVAQDAMSNKISAGPIDISGVDGNDGADGLGGRVWRIYFRKSSTTPTLPDVTPEISSVTNAVDIQRPNGWARTIPGGTNPLYMLIQSTQPNADNTAGSDNISTMTPIPQTGTVEDTQARTDILNIRGGQAGQTAVNLSTVNLRTIMELIGQASDNPAGVGLATLYERIEQAAGSGSGGGGSGTPGAAGLPGRTISIFFRQAASAPANPSVSINTSGTHITINTPSGWSTSAPTNPTQKVWALVQSTQPNAAQDAASNSISSGAIQMTGNDGTDGVGTQGDPGLAGRVNRIFFRRSSTSLTAPAVATHITGGRVDIQTPSGWSTSIPTGNNQLYMLIQSTQPNVANTGGTHSISTLLAIPQAGASIDQDARDDITAIRGGQAGESPVTLATTNLRTLKSDFDDNEEQIDKIKGGQAGQTAVNPDTTNLRTLKSDADGNEEQINKIKGGQTGQTAVNPDQTNLRTLNADLTAIKGSGYQSSTTLKSLQDDSDEVGSPSGNLSYYADQNTTSISSAQAASQAIWVWLTRFSFSIRNLKNRLGASTDTDDIDSNGVWARVNQIKTWLGNPFNNTISYFGSATANSPITALLSSFTMWGWMRRFGTSVLNLYNKHNVNVAAITAIQTLLSNLPDSSSTRPPRYVETMDELEGETELNGIPLADLGFQGGDLVFNQKPKAYKVIATHPPLDHPIDIGSNSENISAASGYFLFGYSRGIIAELTTKQKGTIGEVNDSESGDLGTDVDAVLNMSDGSIQNGKFVVAMKIAAAFVPKEITIHIPASERRGISEDFDETFNLEEYKRTTTHIFYWTSNHMEAELGIEPLWGDAEVGEGVNFEVGLKDAAGNNYLLAAATALHFRELHIGRLVYNEDGDEVNRPPPSRIGEQFFARDSGNEYVVKPIGNISGFLMAMEEVGNGIYGWTQKTRGAISRQANGEMGVLAKFNEISVDLEKEELRVGVNSDADYQALSSVDIGKENFIKQSEYPAGVAKDRVNFVLKPESETHGQRVKFAGLRKDLVSLSYFYMQESGNATNRDGQSIANRYIGVSKWSSGNGNIGNFGISGELANGDAIYIDRSSDSSIRAAILNQNHPQVKTYIMGQKFVPVIDGDKVEFRIPAPNATGDLAVARGTYNTNYNCSIYEVELDLSNSNADDSFIHTSIAPAEVTGSNRLYLFARRYETGTHGDFKEMEVRDGLYFELTPHTPPILDNNSSGVSNPYARHKWNFANAQSLHNDLSALEGDWYFGIAIMERNGISNGTPDLVKSLIPVPINRVFVAGVMIPMTLHSVVVEPVGANQSQLRFHYKTGAYTAKQREQAYPAATAANRKDVFVPGILNLDLFDKFGMGYYRFYRVEMIGPIKQFDNVYINFNNNAAAYNCQEDQIFWERRLGVKEGRIFARDALLAAIPKPDYIGEKGSVHNNNINGFADYRNITAMRESSGIHFLSIPAKYNITDSTWDAVPADWKDQYPDEMMLVSFMQPIRSNLVIKKIVIPVVANSKVQIYVIGLDSPPANLDGSSFSVFQRETGDVGVDPISNFTTSSPIRRTLVDNLYYGHIIEASNNFNISEYDDITYFLFSMFTAVANNNFTRPRRPIEWVAHT